MLYSTYENAVHVKTCSNYSTCVFTCVHFYSVGLCPVVCNYFIIFHFRSTTNKTVSTHEPARDGKVNPY